MDLEMFSNFQKKICVYNVAAELQQFSLAANNHPSDHPSAEDPMSIYFHRMLNNTKDHSCSSTSPTIHGLSLLGLVLFSTHQWKDPMSFILEML